MKFKLLQEALEEAQQGESCDFFGRVSGVRKHKNRVFVDITDHTGLAQVVIEKTDESFDTARTLNPGTYVHASGILGQDRQHQPELSDSSLEVLAESTLDIVSPWDIQGDSRKASKQVFGFTEAYVANPQRAAILAIKAEFGKALHEYFQQENFTLVEPPIITNKTLYPNDNTIEATVHGEDVYLSQCATFELEPLAMAFGRVYTISPAFRNEQSGSRRHLAEYTHAKAELLHADTADLMQLSGEALHYALSKVADRCERDLSILGTELDIDGLHPDKHEHMTYDEALKVSQKKGSHTIYGEGLKRRDEIAATKHVGEKYLWIECPPFESEGFPYKRNVEHPHLSGTCDLIAPNGGGEIVGVAEKITDPEELIVNLIEKGLKDRISQYWQYIAMREYGMPPHGGIGAAPERIIYGMLDLDHIRLTRPWPRYPGRRIVQPDSLNTFGSDNLQGLVEKYGLGSEE